MQAPNEVRFPATVQREGTDIDVEVMATVTWSSGMDGAGYQSGFIVEDLTAYRLGIPISLYGGEKEAFKNQALAAYLT